MSKPSWAHAPFLALDTETTGLDAAKDALLELAWVRFEGLAPRRWHCALFADAPKPSRESEGITGIRAKMLPAGRPGTEILADLEQAALEADFLVAYNAPFDRRFLQRRLPFLSSKIWLDPFVLATHMHPDGRGLRLQKNAERFGLRPRRWHRALPDATAAGELFVRILPVLPAEAARSLSHLAERQEQWRREQDEAWQRRKAARAARSDHS